jgi:hypothetical protein
MGFCALEALYGVQIESSDPAAAFALQLLRAAVMLTGLAGDLIDAIPPDAYPGEEPGAVFVGMLSGTIVTAVGDADVGDVRRATELIATACERVVEHLRLALELSHRMHADGGDAPGRAYG